jgi:hypothetical protein
VNKHPKHPKRRKRQLDSDGAAFMVPGPKFVFARDGGIIARTHVTPIDHPPEPVNAVDEPNPLYVYEPSDLNELTVVEVREVWERRLELCGSVEAAAEAFALMRVGEGMDDAYRGWRAYLNHPLIAALADDLGSMTDDEAVPQTAIPLSLVAETEFDDMLVDRREVASRNVRLRKGQSAFRQEVLGFHGGKCCVTGCTEEALLEAAHVAPFRGEHTHDVRNGMALRIDIHRLFDRFLIAIDPHDLVVRVAPSVSDKFYRSLDGRRVFRASNAPHRSLLEIHFAQFVSRL